MPSLNFPNSPASGATYTFNNQTWLYVDGGWKKVLPASTSQIAKSDFYDHVGYNALWPQGKTKI